MIDALRRQFDLAWALADLHLNALTPDDMLWEPAAVVWTMHRDGAEAWYPDWAETEPDPLPVPTIGWLTWHILYWWTSALAAVSGREAPAPGEIGWSGPDSAVPAIAALRDRWLQTLSTLTPDDLAAPCAYPWGPDAGRTVADTVLWLNVELTKNGAEIGQLRMLRALAP